MPIGKTIFKIGSVDPEITPNNVKKRLLFI